MYVDEHQHQQPDEERQRGIREHGGHGKPTQQKQDSFQLFGDHGGLK